MSPPGPRGTERSRAELAPRAVRAAPIALGAAVVLLQIAYPLVPPGPGRDRLTVLTVLVFFAASVTHAWAWRGVRFAVWLVVIVGGGGMVAETVGVATGFPFGPYRYEGTLGPELAGVPVVIPMAWTMMAYPAYCVARRLAGASAVLGVAVGAWGLTAWDLFLDPQMVDAGHWRWIGDGPALQGIPLTNYAGWYAIALAMMAGLWAVGRPAAGGEATGPSWPRPADGVPYGLYLWVYASSLLAHLAFFGLPGSAVVGGIGMGVVAVPLARTLIGEARR